MDSFKVHLGINFKKARFFSKGFIYINYVVVIDVWIVQNTPTFSGILKECSFYTVWAPSIRF